MSGDVQPRKRKDKKRKKDELGVEEPRGTAAALGEGDVFMHSHHDHGTGGHWCAKIIFFSLLAVLVTLIGLIILENRGVSELEANSVETRYSGVLEGWLEDAPDDDHHDEHTLELLKQHDIEDDHDQEHDVSQEDQEEIDHDENISGHDDDDDEDENSHGDDDDENSQADDADDQEASDEDEEPENVYDVEQSDDDDDDKEDNDDTEHGDGEENEQDDSEEQQLEESDEADDNEPTYDNDESGEENDDLQKVEDAEDEDDNYQNDQSVEDDVENSRENDDEEDEEHEEEEADSGIEVEKLEKEVSDEDIRSEEHSNRETADDDNSQEVPSELSLEDDDDANDDDDVEDDEFLDDDIDEALPVVERIVAPKGKPFTEVEDEPTTSKPADTLADEEEYEKQQEELRRDEAQASHEDGGNSVEDDWPGEPSDKYWRQQLDEAEQELRQGAWSAAVARLSADELRRSARARWLVARALDAQAEAKRDNRVLSRAIAAYLEVLKHNERLSNARLREIATQTLDRIRFRGNYLSAEPIYRLLIRRFPDIVDYRNNLTVSFLMANRADLAEEVIRETLQKWPEDRFALAHLGFILKTQHKRLEEAVEALQKALEGDVGPATEPRFYYHLGDSLLLLNRFTEAHEVHKRGAKLGHFLSPNQRSLYNVNRLKSHPWWNIEQTPYMKLANALEKNWKDILKEGQAAQALYEKEKEGLKERGEWSQLDIFVRGQEVPGRCKEAPVTCRIVRAEQAAAGCRRGQVKFSAIEAGTHVRPHVGPTNCRLRMHLGLSNTKDTYIRVDQETRQWQVGKVFMFDDSFEHEVWHNGTGTRLVLIVDVWHPALTPDERRQLPAI